MMKRFQWLKYDILKRPYRLVQTVKKGQGQPVLVIHGLGTSGHTWQPLTKRINPRKWRLIGFDLLGFGKSPKPLKSTYDVNEHARSIMASLDRPTRREKLVIIGHSMGCLIASHIAWKYPNRVERLILYEPPLFADSPEFRSHKRRKRLYFALYNELLQRPKILFTYSKLLTKRFTQGDILKIDQQSWTAFERSLKNTIMDQRAYDELKAIRVPTDIIYGKFDLVVTRRDVKDMLKANPYVTFHLVNEMHDVTDRAAKYIINLLEKPSQPIVSR